MLGAIDGDKNVREALPLRKRLSPGAQAARYELRAGRSARADREARAPNMELIGIYPFASRLRRLFLRDAI